MYMGYVGIMENKMETTGSIGVIYSFFVAISLQGREETKPLKPKPLK